LLNYEKEFINSIRDDFNTREATRILLEATNYINKNVIGSETFTLYFTSYNFYNIASRIYGLWEDIFYGKESKENLTNILLNIIIDIRNELRKNKNYELSDKIREELRKIGIDLLDQGNKTIYRFI